jgi:hypothetical protein
VPQPLPEQLDGKIPVTMTLFRIAKYRQCLEILLKMAMIAKF